MKQIDQNVMLFNILFKNNDYIQIGLSEHLENVRNNTINSEHILIVMAYLHLSKGGQVAVKWSKQ